MLRQDKKKREREEMDTHFRPYCQIEPDNFVGGFPDGVKGVWGSCNISNNFDSKFFFFSCSMRVH